MLRSKPDNDYDNLEAILQPLFSIYLSFSFSRDI